MASILDTASKLFDKSMDVASDVFEKGKETASDFAGSASDLAAKGKIKAKLYDQGLVYDKLMRRLGEALYDQLKDDPTYVDANQSLFAEIAACVQRRQELEDQLAEIDAAAAASKPIDVTPIQPKDKGTAE